MQASNKKAPNQVFSPGLSADKSQGDNSLRSLPLSLEHRLEFQEVLEYQDLADKDKIKIRIYSFRAIFKHKTLKIK